MKKFSTNVLVLPSPQFTFNLAFVPSLRSGTTPLTHTVMIEQGRKMMEFSKQVLQKVSFDQRLFKKELIKARRWLGQHDQLVLKAWCLATFGHMYKDIILEAFQKTMRA